MASQPLLFLQRKPSLIWNLPSLWLHVLRNNSDLGSPKEGFSNCYSTSLVKPVSSHCLAELLAVIDKIFCTGLVSIILTYFSLLSFLIYISFLFFLSFLTWYSNNSILFSLTGLLPAAPWTQIWLWSASNWEKLLLLLKYLFRMANTLKPESSEPK